MMKQKKELQVVRHAKSSWDYDGIADIDRTLKERGILNAYEISRKLKLNSKIPDRIISSPADRAMHTAVIFARVFDLQFKDFQINNILYESSLEKILELIRGLPGDCHSVMLFGHNPDVTDLVNHFVKKPVENIPTSGVAILTFVSPGWDLVSRENLDGEVVYFPGREE